MNFYNLLRNHQRARGRRPAMTVELAAKTAHVRQPVIGKEDERWQRLHQIIDQRSLSRGEFKLSSGGTSNYFFQLRQTTMHAEGQFLIGMIVTEFMQKHDLRCVGGLELGAVPVVSAAAFASFVRESPIDAFFVRKKAKGHGAQELIDGELPDGSEVLMVDDVTTTGGSVLVAIDNAKAQKNFNVRWALSVVDREEGAAKNLGERGIRLASIFTRADFGLQ
jgi:orotate phosphoribosyltransferase